MQRRRESWWWQARPMASPTQGVDRPGPRPRFWQQAGTAVGRLRQLKLKNILSPRRRQTLPETVTSVSLHPRHPHATWRETAASGGRTASSSAASWRTRAFPRRRDDGLGRGRSTAATGSTDDCAVAAARTRRVTTRSRTRSGINGARPDAAHREAGVVSGALSRHACRMLRKLVPVSTASGGRRGLVTRFWGR